ncbi:hypothetical protein UFOVP929_40 [uncultured Caudovirales phage]|uniref:Uncharacterized protein n=1 Tax=uncultured Caudovirales phage TaxID=2100421 RepID=A0A6J5PS18_9CAUD|nr:hypothetical protein UFOVP929_40 [uncultured Caudovirales phage]
MGYRRGVDVRHLWRYLGGFHAAAVRVLLLWAEGGGHRHDVRRVRVGGMTAAGKAKGGGGASALPGVVASARIERGIARLVRGDVLTAQEMAHLRDALATLRVGGAA